jgi:hypothetical protein
MRAAPGAVKQPESRLAEAHSASIGSSPIHVRSVRRSSVIPVARFTRGWPGLIPVKCITCASRERRARRGWDRRSLRHPTPTAIYASNPCANCQIRPADNPDTALTSRCSHPVSSASCTAAFRAARASSANRAAS